MVKRETRRAGQVYFIQSGDRGLIKIGSAVNSRRRRGELQTGNPDDLVLHSVFHADDCDLMEKRLHRRFRHLHVRGEWFRADAELHALARSGFSPDDASVRLAFHSPVGRGIDILRGAGEDDQQFFERAMMAVHAAT
jgi:hypothetical protein